MGRYLGKVVGLTFRYGNLLSRNKGNGVGDRWWGEERHKK